MATDDIDWLRKWAVGNRKKQYTACPEVSHQQQNARVRALRNVSLYPILQYFWDTYSESNYAFWMSSI